MKKPLIEAPKEPPKEPASPSDRPIPDAPKDAAAAEPVPPPVAATRHGTGTAVFAGVLIGVALALGAGYATLPLWEPSSHDRLVVADPVTAGPAMADLNARLAALEAQARQDAAAAPGDTVADLENRRAQISGEMQAVLDRLVRLEDELTGIARLVEATTRPSIAAEARDSLRALSDRVAGLEKGEGGQDIGALRGRSDQLTAAVSALAEKVGTLETRHIREARTEERRGLIAAIDRLREILPRGAPFAAELAVLSAAARGHPDVLTIVGDLESHAATGVPTLAVVQRSFDDAALGILQAVSAGAGGGLLDRAWGRLAALVTIRKIGPLAGDGPEARVARAEAALKDGDLMAAIAELEGLSGSAAEAAAPWLRDARARLAVERAMTRLHIQSVALLGSGGD